MRTRLLLASLALAAAAPGMAQPAATEPTESLRFACDALNVAGQLNKTTLQALGPAHSLEAAAAVLDKHKVRYTRQRNVLTLSNAPSTIVRQIYELPQGEPIVLPNGQDTTICVPVPSADSI